MAHKSSMKMLARTAVLCLWAENTEPLETLAGAAGARFIEFSIPHGLYNAVMLGRPATFAATTDLEDQARRAEMEEEFKIEGAQVSGIDSVTFQKIEKSLEHVAEDEKKQCVALRASLWKALYTGGAIFHSFLYVYQKINPIKSP